MRECNRPCWSTLTAELSQSIYDFSTAFRLRRDVGFQYLFKRFIASCCGTAFKHTPVPSISSALATRMTEAPVAICVWDKKSDRPIQTRSLTNFVTIGRVTNDRLHTNSLYLTPIDSVQPH